MIMQQNPIAPVVGMPCCSIHYTDRYPYTVTEVISEREIKVRPNKYEVLDFYAERYNVLPEFEEGQGTFTKRKDGRWIAKGQGMKHGLTIALNTHAMRIDPCF